ncbi:MAG TPA: phenylacetate-CoA oxygenase subunit PaaI [Candidatus Marinimicrobia bacterium]|nr:phenylacetate-CoA oxygenase subunit PaaI [Candidatus Neomarinimicrobiota bacterium]
MAKDLLYQFILGLGDDALILGQRLSQWAYKGPFLEEDIALSNISLDMFGRANLLLEYAATLKGNGTTSDELAFKRNEREFSNHIICEQPNGNFADTIVRQFFLDAFYKLFLQKLTKSKDEQLSAIAQKSIKETTYHLRHSSKWIIRLGDGTVESHAKVQSAIDNLWMFTNELFEMNEIDNEMLEQKIGVDCSKLKIEWDKIINEVLSEATLNRPEDANMPTGGRQGIHTEHLGHLLSDMQYLQRAYPDATW